MADFIRSKAAWLALLVGMAACGLGCGQAGKTARCSTNAGCAANHLCATPVSGESGVCIPSDSDVSCALACGESQVCKGGQCQERYVVTVNAPSQVVGPKGATVLVTVVKQYSDSPDPASVAIVGDGKALFASGSSGTYTFVYSAPADVDGLVTLAATATAEGLGVNTSAAVQVPVDTLGPIIAGVTMSCSDVSRSECPLDLVGVSASVTDSHLSGTATGVVAVVDHPEIATAPVTLSCQGGACQGTIDLGSLGSFPYLSHGVEVTLTATDSLGNTGSGQARKTATRVKWIRHEDGVVRVTSPVVLADGSIVVGTKVTETTGTLVKYADGAKSFTKTGIGPIVAAPSAKGSYVWAGSAGASGDVYVVDKDAGTLHEDFTTSGPVVATPAVGIADSASDNTAYVGSPGAFNVFQEDAAFISLTMTGTSALLPFFEAAATTRSGTAYGVSNGILFHFDLWNSKGTEYIGFDWQQTVAASNAHVRVAIGPSDQIWTAALEPGGELDETMPPDSGASPVFSTRAQLTRPTTEPIFLSDTGLVIGYGPIDGNPITPKIHRYSTVSFSSPSWSTELATDGVSDGDAGTPMVLALGNDQQLIVPTSNGALYAIDASDGRVIWKGQVAAIGQALYEGNVFTASGKTVGMAYFGSSDGNLYAVIVEGKLANTPWPKAHHDPQNSGYTATPLP